MYADNATSISANIVSEEAYLTDFSVINELRSSDQVDAQHMP